MTLKSIVMKAGLAGALLFSGSAAALSAEAFTTTELNVRGGPGTQYGVVDTLNEGESVDVLTCTGEGWCEIEHSGPDGWVSANYLSRDGIDDDDGIYFEDDDDVDVNIVVRGGVGRPGPGPGPFFRPGPGPGPGPFFRPGRPGVQAGFCFGSPNARFCVRG